MIQKAAKLSEALRYRGGVSSLLNSKPRSLTSWLIANRIRNLDLEFRTVIDGGANIGQFARAAHTCFPQAKIISFEPLPDIARALRRNLSDAPNFKVIEAALGASDGQVEFYRHGYSQSSSVRKMLHKLDGLMSKDSEVERLQVPMLTLDTALKDETFERPALLKLDLQGYELEALKGATGTLEQCSHVLLETVFDQQYVDEPIFDVIWEFLRSKGFAFSQPVNFAHGATGRIVQMDALFSASSRE